MIKQFKKIRLRISVWWVVSMSMLFFLNGWYSFCIIAFSAFCHEAGHLICMASLGASPLEITFGFLNFNIKYNKNTKSYKTDLLISISGIVANIILCAVAYHVNNTELFFVNLSLAAVNLLPFESLDGGNIIRCFTESDWFMKKELRHKSLLKNIKRMGKVSSYAFVIAISVASGFNLSVVFSGVSFLVGGELNCQSLAL